MNTDAFTLESLKSILDEAAIGAQAHAAAYFSQNIRVKMASLSMTFDLVRTSTETFAFAGPDSANLIHARYAHHLTADSELQIGHINLGTDNA